MAAVTSCDAPHVRVFPVNERELAGVPGVQPPVHYHSLIAEKGPGHDRHREFVVFHASENVCPEYLIAYQRVSSVAGSQGGLIGFDWIRLDSIGLE